MSTVSSVLPEYVPVPVFITTSLSYVWFFFNDVVTKIPGGSYVISYIKKSHRDDPYRTAIELGLLIYALIYYLSKPQQKKGLQSSQPNLSAAEMDALIEEWEPEPMVDDSLTEFQNWRLQKIPEMKESGVQTRINFTRDNGKESYNDVLNMCSNNFLQLSTTKRIEEVAKTTIKNYGVGACGPAGFYGNQDVHYHLEYELAKFFGTDSAVLYGQDFCVAASVIPAFTKRGDILVADNDVSLAVQNALQLSRSTVYYYDHNNMESLEALLAELTEAEQKDKPPAIPRKFIVTEAIFTNTGDIAPLPELTRLKRKYKFRLFVDETLSLGVLGPTGRGLPEHYGLDRASSIDITVGSLANALGSSGGFVLGDHVMSQHQHIGSNAYCFSASLPAYTTTCAAETLKILAEDNTTVSRVHKLSSELNQFFNDNIQLRQYITVTSSEHSPIQHIELSDDYRQKKFGYSKDQLFQIVNSLQKKCITSRYIEPYEDEEKFLQEIVDEVLEKHNILITRNTLVLKSESVPIVPSLKISCTAAMSDNDIENVCQAVSSAILNHCQ
ncbi:Serine palmitoyltransferase 1 [Nakaseomyces bracarensis]|uniref:serine C-palmitoyltransferase n=1 Tax=Nakaseomyces bracarensis TaxID=273131 RepID=A0ABR4NWY0_9SACH